MRPYSAHKVESFCSPSRRCLQLLFLLRVFFISVEEILKWSVLIYQTELLYLLHVIADCFYTSVCIQESVQETSTFGCDKNLFFVRNKDALSKYQQQWHYFHTNTSEIHCGYASVGCFLWEMTHVEDSVFWRSLILLSQNPIKLQVFYLQSNGVCLSVGFSLCA